MANPLNIGIRRGHPASNTPCLAHDVCPILSTQMSSTVLGGSLQADARQGKFSTECTSKERPCQSFPVPIYGLPGSTGGTRDRPGPLEPLSHSCISLRPDIHSLLCLCCSELAQLSFRKVHLQGILSPV